MTILPVIKREVRGEARRPFNYWLRVLGAGVAMGVCASIIWRPEEDPVKLGAKLFAILHTTIFVTIWVMVPALTADCLSREKREGTLGLLFLTPLTARSIVVGKSLVHALRSMTLWLSVVPILAIPILLGGVSWLDVMTAFTLEFCAVLLALAAGLLASSSAKRWTRALLLAQINSVLFASIFWGLLGFVFWHNVTAPRPNFPFAFGLQRGVVELVQFASWLSTGMIGFGNDMAGWSNVIARLPGWTIKWLPILGQMAALSMLLFILVVLLAARRVDRTWQEEPPSERILWWERMFCTPILWLSFFRRMMRRKLEKNPIGWLEQRTWSGRLVTWSWFAVMISLYSAVMSNSGFYLRGFHGLQICMGWLLAGTIAFSAAGSLRRERETGVLELLLVSPVSVGQIISGRVRGLWGQFLPAVVVLLTVWLYFANIFNSRDKSDASDILFFGGVFLTLPVVGLYFSLRSANFISSFLWTVFVGLLLPGILAQVVGLVFVLFLWRFSFDFSFLPWPVFTRTAILTTMVQIVLAVHFWRQLNRNLTTRTFVLDRTIT